eukprot:222087-Prymnesium_polylepis.1
MAVSAAAEGCGAACVAVGTHDRLAPLMAASAAAEGCGAVSVAVGPHDRFHRPPTPGLPDARSAGS